MSIGGLVKGEYDTVDEVIEFLGLTGDPRQQRVQYAELLQSGENGIRRIWNDVKGVAYEEDSY